MPPTISKTPTDKTSLAAQMGLLTFFRKLLTRCLQTSAVADHWFRSHPNAGLIQHDLAERISHHWAATSAAWLPSDNDPRGLAPPWPPNASILAEPHFRDVPVEVVFRSAATALHSIAEDSLTNLYYEALAAAAGRVEQGDLLYFETGWPHPRELFGLEADYNTNPETLIPTSRRSPVPKFGIADSPSFALYNVILDDTCREPLDDLFGDASSGLAAVAVPNSSLADYNISHPELPPEENGVVFREDSGGTPRFFGVRPLDLEAQRRRLGAMTSAAVDRKAAIILFPELSVTEDMLKHFRAVLANATATCLLVPGSYHDMAEHQHNVRGWLIWPQGNGSAPLAFSIQHQKFEPVVTSLPGREGAHSEDLDPCDAGVPPRRTLRIYRGTRHRLAVLVCRDALDAPLREVLEALRVNVVLIPAMSPTHGPFDDLANHVAARIQGMTLIAMTPWDDKGPSAMIRLPRRNSRPFWVRQNWIPTNVDEVPTDMVFVGDDDSVILPNAAHGPTLPPGLCLFDWRAFTCRWLGKQYWP